MKLQLIQNRDFDFGELEEYYYEAKTLKYTKPFDMKGRLLFAYQNTSIQGKNVFDLNCSVIGLLFFTFVNANNGP